MKSEVIIVLAIVILATVIALLSLVGLAGAGPLARPNLQAGAPTVVSYQGQVKVGGSNYNGTGYFKFAILDGSDTIQWSNDGNSPPTNAVSLDVDNGLFNVLLGDTSLTNMTTLLASAFSGTERYLRVWFSQSASGPFTQLSPDRRIAAVPYALQAEEAKNAETLDTLDSSDFWQLSGNAGTDPTTHFLGTTDGVTLTLVVSGTATLRLEPHAVSPLVPYATTPNIIGGYGSNSVQAGVGGATISGGGENGAINQVTDCYGTVSGGFHNQTGNRDWHPGNASYATVGGGRDNTASHYHATVGGGAYNTASGYAATVPGGAYNEADGDYSFAAGRRAKANNQGCFVWGDSTDADVTCDVGNAFVIRASGGVTMYTNSSLTSGMYLASGGSSWNAVSDRERKENFEPVNNRELVARLAEIPITTWNYKAQDHSIRHIGPMAQDFNELVEGLGAEGADYINTLDADGVALAAIQGLYQLSQEQATRIEELEARVAGLEQVVGAVYSSQPNPDDRWLLLGGLVLAAVVVRQWR